LAAWYSEFADLGQAVTGQSESWDIIIIIIIIIHEFHRDASLEQNFRAVMYHVLHYCFNVNAAVADSLRCRMICGTFPFSVHA